MADGIDFAKSERERAAMLRRFGFVPSSVLSEIKRGYLSARMFTLQREEPKRRLAEDATVRRGQLEAVGRTGRLPTKVRTDKAAVSIMPAELVDFFVRYYAKRGQTYIDPFMGQGVQLQVAVRCGLNYWGYDASVEFFRYIEAIIPKLGDELTRSLDIKAFRGDSRKPDEIPDATGNFSFTSPPYWDVEFYGDEPEQLGRGKTYEEFLKGMAEIAAAWLPKFKPGAWNVVNVGDMRRGGKFYAYHVDLTNIYRAAGWVLHDTWIVDGLLASASQIFAVQHNNRHVAPRVHEYALVFRAP